MHSKDWKRLRKMSGRIFSFPKIRFWVGKNRGSCRAFKEVKREKSGRGLQIRPDWKSRPLIHNNFTAEALGDGNMDAQVIKGQ